MAGIDLNTFYHMNLKEANLILDAYKFKKEAESKENDFVCWLNGRYICEAISACFSKNHKYPSEYYSMKTEEVHEIQTDEEMLKAMERLVAKSK